MVLVYPPQHQSERPCIRIVAFWLLLSFSISLVFFDHVRKSFSTPDHVLALLIGLGGVFGAITGLLLSNFAEVHDCKKRLKTIYYATRLGHVLACFLCVLGGLLILFRDFMPSLAEKGRRMRHLNGKSRAETTVKDVWGEESVREIDLCQDTDFALVIDVALTIAEAFCVLGQAILASLITMKNISLLWRFCSKMDDHDRNGELPIAERTATETRETIAA